LILTMAASFSISFAIMWRQHKADEMPLPVPVAGRVSAPTPLSAALPAALPMPAEPGSAVSPRSRLAGPSVPRQVRPAPEAAPQSNSDAPALPVMLNIVKTTAYVDDGTGTGAKANKEVYEAIISNDSQQQLDISVTEMNLPTMESSEAQISLAKGNQLHFGVGRGLKLLSGDQITLRSPNYRELTQPIP